MYIYMATADESGRSTVPVNEKFLFHFRNTIVLFRDYAALHPCTVFNARACAQDFHSI